MTPDELIRITGVITAIGFFFLVHQLYWQLRIGLVDRQARSAFFFLLATTIVIAQLVISYSGGPSFGNTTRGVVCYFLWVGTLVWWGYCTLVHNWPAMRKIRQAEKQQKEVVKELTKKLRKPLDSVNKR